MLDAAAHARLTQWRRHLHAHPEIAFGEAGTAAFVAARLAEMGIAHETGVGGHGVVATISRPGGNRAVALRADMDALPIEEATGAPWASTSPGVMHACGHDGHTTALLGAAEELAADPDWTGTVHLIFQPAEEVGGGAKAMIEDGLFERFPFDRVFGFHNWPGIEAGTVALNVGAAFAAGGRFIIRLTGTPGHAAMPHLTRDPIAATGALIGALQSVVARNVDPLAPAVVTIAMLRAGTAGNQIPESAELTGTIRALSVELRTEIGEHVSRVARGVADAFGVKAEIEFLPGGLPCINAAAETDLAEAAALAVGARVTRALPPIMGGDDMSRLLDHAPGCYARIGTGPAPANGELHGPAYDFNDAILPTAVAWLVEVAKQGLSAD